MRFLILALLLCPAGGALAAPSAFVQEAQCVSCKAKLKPDAKFCTGCGEKVPVQACAECKAELKPGAKFCTGCGAKVAEAAPAKPAEPAKPADPAKPAEPEKPAEPKPKVVAAEPDAAKPQVGQDSTPDAVKMQRGEDLEKFGVTHDQINRAIDKAAAFLAAKLLKSNYHAGEDYVICYALIHTPIYHSNGKLRQRIEGILRDPEWMKRGPAIYVAGLRALALEATRDPDLMKLTGECAQYIVEAQGPRGTWTYEAQIPAPPAAEARPDAKPGITVSGGEPLDEPPPGEEVAFKGIAKQKPNDGDQSCTQFALLGLHAAEKAGYRIPKTVWKKCLDEMLKRHCKDGGWNYHSPQPTSYGSMTCAGVCSVALCRYYLGEKDYIDHPAIRSGIEWLAKNFSVSKNVGHNQWPMYYLYSVERVGVLAATESIGTHRWYPLGAKHLVAIQRADGAWKPDTEDEHVGTAFGLLFLTRATAPVKHVKRGGKGVLESHALNDAQNYLFILDASGSMREEMDGREKFDIAKEVVEAIVTKLPEGTQVGLRVYGHRFTSLQDEANTDSELLVPVGPLKLPEFLAKVKALRCKGKTPITHSLLESAKDVTRVPADVDVVTVLLTDGGESTRGAKPDEAAAKLVSSKKGMKLHVVGFDIGDDAWREQLEATAAAGGGVYVHAPKAKELLEALAIVTGGGSGAYAVLDKAGQEVLKGKLGDRHVLPEGKYEFVFERPDKSVEKRGFWINTDVVTHVTVRLLKK